jgi:hypothetical protein
MKGEAPAELVKYALDEPLVGGEESLDELPDLFGGLRRESDWQAINRHDNPQATPWRARNVARGLPKERAFERLRGLVPQPIGMSDI